jgi:hypothetical protein
MIHVLPIKDLPVLMELAIWQNLSLALPARSLDNARPGHRPLPMLAPIVCRRSISAE